MKKLDLSRLPHRMLLALWLAPAFWLPFLWAFFLSSQNRIFSIYEVLAFTALLSYACAYCVTQFVIAFRETSLDSRSSLPVEEKATLHAQTHQ